MLFKKAFMKLQKVIDQNYLREPNESLHIYLNKGNQVVLTDFACMESYKGNSLINLKRSQEIISQYPKQVIILKSTQEVINLTKENIKAVRERLIDEDQTKHYAEFCHILKHIDERGYQNQYDDLMQKSHEANEFFKTKEKDARKILKGIELSSKSYNSDELKMLRSKKELTKKLMDEFLYKITKHIMILATMLMKKNNFMIYDLDIAKGNYIFRSAAANFFLGLKWISDSGYENINWEKFQNDVIDMTYVTYGTYFDGVLSKDEKLKQIYKILKQYIDNL